MRTRPAQAPDPLIEVASGVAGALGGAIAVSVAGFTLISPWLAVLGLRFGPEGVVQPPDWVGLVYASVGAVAGGVTGVLARRRQLQRQAAFRSISDSLGGEFTPEEDQKLDQVLAKFFPEADSLHTSDVMRVRIGGISLTACDLTYSVSTGSDSDRRTRSVSQTVAWFASDAVRFPQFELEPENDVIRRISGALGLREAPFPEHPEFSENYRLGAVQPEATRRLFSGSVLEAIAPSKGLRVSAYGRELLVCRSGEVCAGEALKGFLDLAAKLCGLFEASARKLGAWSQPRGAQTDTGAGPRLPGLSRRMAGMAIVPKADVEAFIRQPPPRRLPPPIDAYRNRLTPVALVLFGALFLFVGMFLALRLGYEALNSRGGLASGFGVGVLFGLAFAAVGGAIVFFAGRARYRAGRLLRQGRVATGAIEGIEATGGKVNGANLFRMTVRFPVDGQTIRATCRIADYAATRARKLAEQGKPATLLYDPAAPQSVLYVDELLNLSPEYE